jgi:hypothetical protein
MVSQSPRQLWERASEVDLERTITATKTTTRKPTTTTTTTTDNSSDNNNNNNR